MAKKKNKKAKNIAAIIFLVVFFTGLIWLINSNSHRRLVAVQDQLTSNGADTVTLVLNANSCHYLIPSGGINGAFAAVICPSCVDVADEIRASYSMQMIDAEFCGRRHEINMFFTKLPKRQ